MKFKHFFPALLVILGLGAASAALANPFYVGQRAASATATSTQTFLVVGTATSTLPIYDSYETGGTNQTNSGNITLPNAVAVLVNGVASSSSSIVNVSCEYSDNYSPATGNGDWYQNDVFAATTTGPNGTNAPVSYQFTYSGTNAVVGGVILPTTRFQKVVTCPVPLRFVRAVVSVSGANASVWTAIIPTKQRN